MQRGRTRLGRADEVCVNHLQAMQMANRCAFRTVIGIPSHRAPSQSTTLLQLIDACKSFHTTGQARWLGFRVVVDCEYKGELHTPQWQVAGHRKAHLALPLCTLRNTVACRKHPGHAAGLY